MSNIKNKNINPISIIKYPKRLTHPRRGTDKSAGRLTHALPAHHSLSLSLSLSLSPFFSPLFFFYFLFTFFLLSCVSSPSSQLSPPLHSFSPNHPAFSPSRPSLVLFVFLLLLHIIRFLISHHPSSLFSLPPLYLSPPLVPSPHHTLPTDHPPWTTTLHRLLPHSPPDHAIEKSPVTPGPSRRLLPPLHLCRLMAPPSCWSRPRATMLVALLGRGVLR